LPQLIHFASEIALTVKKLLGPKQIENATKYIGIVNFKDDGFEVTTATTLEEATSRKRTA
jgi:hypothetical protein